MENELRLRVAEAKQRDTGRGKARINEEVMRTLSITAGDIIEVKGKRTTAAVAWPAYQEDANQDIIRVDGLIRKNAGAAMNEYVSVKKADYPLANLRKDEIRHAAREIADSQPSLNAGQRLIHNRDYLPQEFGGNLGDLPTFAQGGEEVGQVADTALGLG